MKLDRIVVPFEAKAMGDGMAVEGYGSVFNVVDHGNDVVVKGAFAQSLTTRMPAMLWSHKRDLPPIGIWTEAKEDERGLFLRGQFADTQAGREAHTLAKMGALTGLSIGYVAPRDKNPVNSKGVRELKAVDLWEVSPVVFPMNEDSRVTAVKSDELYDVVGALKHVLSGDLTERESEACLRDAGFSNKQAETFIASLKGYRGLLRGGSVPSGEAYGALLESVKRLASAPIGADAHGTHTGRSQAGA